MLEASTVRLRTPRLCWQQTYLCSDHLVLWELCTLRSVRKRRTSFWSRSPRISSKPFRWRAFCLLQLRNNEKTTAIWWNPNNYRAIKVAATLGVKSCTVISAHFVPLNQGASLWTNPTFYPQWLLLQTDEYSFLISSRYPVPVLHFFPLVPFKAFNPPNPWHYIEIPHCCTFPEANPYQAFIFWYQNRHR